MVSLAPHQQRVVTELAELRDRHTKLEKFMDGTAYMALPLAERVLLFWQRHAQESLITVLASRVELFTHREPA